MLAALKPEGPTPTEVYVFLTIVAIGLCGLTYILFCWARGVWRGSALRVNPKNAQETLDKYASWYYKGDLVLKALNCGAVARPEHLIEAAKLGDVERMTLIRAQQGGLDVNKAFENETPLGALLRNSGCMQYHRWLESIDFLLEHNATVNARDYRYCVKEPLNCLEIFLSRGIVDPNRYEDAVRTPLSDAVLGGHSWVPQTLLEYGADIQPALRILEEAYARNGSQKALKGLRHLRSILRARGALDPAEPKTVWDHLDDEE